MAKGNMLFMLAVISALLCSLGDNQVLGNVLGYYPSYRQYSYDIPHLMDFFQALEPDSMDLKRLESDSWNEPDQKLRIGHLYKKSDLLRYLTRSNQPFSGHELEKPGPTDFLRDMNQNHAQTELKRLENQRSLFRPLLKKSSDSETVSLSPTGSMEFLDSRPARENRRYLLWRKITG